MFAPTSHFPTYLVDDLLCFLSIFVFSKTSAPIDLTLSGIVTVSREVQSPKAPSDISVTVLGIVTFVSFVLPRNALRSI